jgi:cytochrome c oxidase subunit I+III
MKHMPDPEIPADPIRLHKALTRIWATGPGLARFSAVNHTTLGLRFMLTAAGFFAFGIAMAMMIRAQLATPRSAFLGPEAYNQVFTVHGTVMMFLFAIPMLEGLAIYLIPKMLGARDLAFPRLTAFGYWCYLFGGLIVAGSLLLGVAPDSGWFMYTPLSSRPYAPGLNADVWLLGVTFVEVSAMTLAVELTVSILKLRAPGMSLDRMPIFAWYVLVTAVMMLVGFPPLILGSVLLELERAVGLPFFDPTRGGDPLLWQHLFWMFGHPEVYVIFLPAAGALSTLIPAMTGRPLIGYRAIVAAIVALAFLSFGIWVHHMFTVGIPHLALAVFSIGSALVAVPTAVQIFAWLATMARGAPQRRLPMLYVFGFFAVFVIGGLTGVMLAMVPFNWQAHDTHFVVAHLHYVLVGGFVFPLLAALYYWLPHVTGRIATHSLGTTAFWTMFTGFNVTFLPMHLTGLLGMPRRVYTYQGHEGWTTLNTVSSIGAFVFAMGLALVAVDVFLQARFGRRAGVDPWGTGARKAGTLDWATPTPPPAYGFAALPAIATRADRLDPRALGPRLAGGRGYLGFARNGWQETLAVDMATGAPEQLVILPRATYLPLWTALTLAAAVLSTLVGLYLLAAAAAAGVVGLLMLAAQSAGQRRDLGPLPIGQGRRAPPHTEVDGSPPWWGLVFTLVADGALFGSLLFGALYLRIIGPAPTTPGVTTPETALSPLTAAAAVAMLVGPLAARGALAANAAGRARGSWIGLGMLAALLAAAALVAAIATAPFDPRDHAVGAIWAALLGYAALHAAIGAIMLTSAALRVRAGYVSAVRRLDLRLCRLFADYAAATGLVALGVAAALPLLPGAGG